MADTKSPSTDLDQHADRHVTDRGGIGRVYDRSTPDRYRLLVDRLWPRGFTKAEAPIDEWLQDVAPSTELRRWYAHDPAKFPEFARRYCDQLARQPGSIAVARLLDTVESQARCRRALARLAGRAS